MLTEREEASVVLVAADKLRRMDSGERVILSDRELDSMPDGAEGRICTAINVRRLGVLDHYVGWTVERAKPVLHYSSTFPRLAMATV